MGYWAPQLRVMETPEPEEQWKWVSPHPVHPKRGALKHPSGMGHPGTEAPASDAESNLNKNQQSKAFLSKQLQY